MSADVRKVTVGGLAASLNEPPRAGGGSVKTIPFDSGLRAPPIPERQVPSGPVPPAPPEGVVIALSHATPPKGSRFVFLSAPDSTAAAAYRVLRQRLSAAGDPRTMVVTSALPAEGKTTCAVNLALCLAEHGRARVLVVEGNVRHPGLARALGFEPPACFADQLARRTGGRAGEPWRVASAFSPHVHVLAVDPLAEGRWVLNGHAFARAIAELSALYDYILVDAPPVLGSADVNVLEDAVDGVLFTGIAGQTSGARLREAAEQLSPARIVGVALLERA